MKYAKERGPHKVVAYMRTASANQADLRRSLERQQTICNAEAHKLGAEIGLFYIDTGKSGLTRSRPWLETLFDDLAMRQTRYVIAADRARLARDPALALALEQQIVDTGAELITADKQ